ncbi:bifunctional lysylphosphatidylglycerol synthetase/lysine--tRNA ligase LysX [Tenggerimyces flavus]|uniref:Lysine--tRNA ligase n=1 Tax=Tenggerimyces flavus TaxID=1708749 RepID=A0ABV7YLL0_9ACTN|nr:bifunctional lysylphosphatidylglycerol synthetase/lysine--tRNA ligase LysX [Tenggerimyces flavus]MBM7787733.1 lysyl-tRNA synthetase class 2 [Tenggerimyces flavus]
MSTEMTTHDAERTTSASSATPERAEQGSRSTKRNAKAERIAGVIATWIARFLRLVAVFSAVTALLPALRGPLSIVRDIIEVTTISAQPNLAYAAYLGILAAAVRRRKRIAWWFLVLLLIVPNLIFGILEVLSNGDGWLSIVVLTLAFGLLLVARPAFHARVAPRAGWRALLALVVMAIFGVVVGLGVVSLFPGKTTTFEDRLQTVIVYIAGGTGSMDPDYFTEEESEESFHHPAHVGVVALGILGAAAQLVAAWVLFRPGRKSLFQTPDDERGIRTLLAQHGENDSLGYFATRRDKSAIWSASGEAAVTYRVVAGVSLASGDPIGACEHWPAAVQAWLDEARRFAWAPAVMGASEAGAECYVESGLDALELGDEAVLHVADFKLTGRHMRSVRQAVNRLERAGFTCRIRRHDEIPRDEMATIVTDTEQWRDTESERGFSMALGRLGDPRDKRCVLVEALDGKGERHAVLSFVPWGRYGLSLDLMRREPAAPNGMVELMVTRLVEAAPRFRVERVSLNFAMFRSGIVEGAQIGAGPVARVWRNALLVASRWWQIESLYRANAKFEPDWMPRFLCYPASRDLVRIGLACGIVEGFLPGFLSGRMPRVNPRLAAEDFDDGWDPWGEAPDTAQLEAERERRLPEQERVRRAKLRRLRDDGVEPYPVGYPRTATIEEIRTRFAAVEADHWTSEVVGITGRVLLMRKLGRLCFATVRDGTGDLQIMIDLDDLGAQETFERWKKYVDIGDHVGVTGVVGTTRSGELTVRGSSWAITSKCLRPLPDKWHGMADPEARVRLRAVDLAIRPEARTIFHQRSLAVSAVRDVLRSTGFLEVETPMLQPVHGGANARPFRTHINAYDMPLYLRIAPELYLKRLLVGGAERVFELNRNFRNEGADATHNPEFTMLEAYQAYGDYESMQPLIRSLVLAACEAVHGSTKVSHAMPDGSTVWVDLAEPWADVTVHDAVGAALGASISPSTPVTELRSLGAAAGVALDVEASHGSAVLELYDKLVEPRTVSPTFYRDFPTEVSPLTRAHRTDPRVAERWDLVAFGMELGTAYSELVDPVEQRLRLTAQSLLAAGGDVEAMQLDEDFLHTLEYGMPPAGGLGMGVDRLVMMLTDLSIRDTLLFPLVRPGKA